MRRDSRCSSQACTQARRASAQERQATGPYAHDASDVSRCAFASSSFPFSFHAGPESILPAPSLPHPSSSRLPKRAQPLTDQSAARALPAPALLQGRRAVPVTLFP